MEITQILPSAPPANTPQAAAPADGSLPIDAAQAEAAAAPADFAALLAGDLAVLAGLALPGNPVPGTTEAEAPQIRAEDAQGDVSIEPALNLVLASIAFPGAAPVQAGAALPQVGPAGGGSAVSMPSVAQIPVDARATTEISQAGGAMEGSMSTPASAPLLPQAGDLPQAQAQVLVAQAEVKPAPAAMLQPTTPPVHAEVRAPMHMPGWDAEIGRVTLWMHSQHHQVAEIRLNPPELGPLQITLRIGGDDGSQVQLGFSAPHSDTRAALESALPRLREMLAESGITLGQATVSAESFAGSGQDAHAQQRDAVPAPGAADTGSGTAPLSLHLRDNAGLIDTFA